MSSEVRLKELQDNAKELTKKYNGRFFAQYNSTIMEFIVTPANNNKLIAFRNDYLQKNEEIMADILNTLPDTEIIICAVFKGGNNNQLHPYFERYHDFVIKTGIS